MAKQEPYPSTLTDREWKVIEPWLRPAAKLGRPPRYGRRLMIDAILYVVRSGCTWRMLPHEFPHWRLVYYYFAKWQKAGLWERLQRVLVEKVRVARGKKKPRALRSSTVKALRWLASPESVASMLARRSWDANDTCWWIPWA